MDARAREAQTDLLPDSRCTDRRRHLMHKHEGLRVACFAREDRRQANPATTEERRPTNGFPHQLQRTRIFQSSPSLSPFTLLQTHAARVHRKKEKDVHWSATQRLPTAFHSLSRSSTQSDDRVKDPRSDSKGCEGQAVTWTQEERERDS